MSSSTAATAPSRRRTVSATASCACVTDDAALVQRLDDPGPPLAQASRSSGVSRISARLSLGEPDRSASILSPPDRLLVPGMAA